MPTSEARAIAEEVYNMDSLYDIAEALDRFAAQRGAEAWLPIEAAPKDGTRIVLTDGDVPAVGLWRAHDEQWIVDWDHEPYQGTIRETPATRWLPLPSNEPGAPPQTGGGDAGERARHDAELIMSRWDALGERYAGIPYEAKVIKERLTRDVEAALRSSHREGAEAMREDCKTECDAAKRDTGSIGDEYEQGWKTAIAVCKARIGALPIPGKTDAG